MGWKADRRGLCRPAVEVWGNPVGGQGQAEEMMVGVEVGPERTQWSRRPGGVGDPYPYGSMIWIRIVEWSIGVLCTKTAD